MQTTTKLNPLGILFLIAVFLGVVVVPQGVYTIESGTVGVLSTFGKYSEDIKTPGLHFKIPVIQTVRVVDTKMQTAHYQNGAQPIDRDGLIRKQKIVVLDNKNLSIGMEITVQFTADAARATEILTKYGLNYFEKLINPIIRDVVRDSVSKYQAEEIARKRNSISSELNTLLQEKFAKLPFTLQELQLRNIDLPEIVRRKIEEVQLAKQEEQRLEMIEKQAEKNQNIKTIEAKTRLIEVTTQAKAEAEKARIEAEAKAFRISKEAEAQAAANKAIAASLSSELIRYEATQRWDGQFPRMLVGDSSASMLMQVPDLTKDH